MELESKTAETRDSQGGARRARATGGLRAPHVSHAPAGRPDERLAQLAAGVGSLRRAQAALAERLIASGAVGRLGYARLRDYARERLGRSARQLQELAKVHRRLGELPALERALVGNALP